MIRIRRALVSVSDKTGLLELAKFLNEMKVEILSTGGSARFLRDSGVPVTDVAAYTGFPEILDGRVKTLHPRIHAGLLAIRDRNTHRAQLEAQGIGEIDLAVVNLYPFREVAARPDAHFEEAIEQIDIGGPSMVRSAAKNHAFVAVATDPADYSWIQKEMSEYNGCLSAATRFILAQKAFALTAAYDASIAAYLAERVWSTEGKPALAEGGLPPVEVLMLEKVRDLRYGENPHQRAALYRRISRPPSGVGAAEFLHGKELSYNNLLDGDAAWNLAGEFEGPAAVVIKHTNPSGVAQADTLHAAYVGARDCDPISAFGSVVALNRQVDEATAAEIDTTFVEVVLAPGFTAEALSLLKQKKNVRLLRMTRQPAPLALHREIDGGFLVQDKDLSHDRPEDWKTVTRRPPSPEEITALQFGWRVVKHVKSNAIVFCNKDRTLGIGAGQMSRVDAVKWGAQRAVLHLAGCVMASDAFFPFPDGIEAAAAYGVRAVIQPGGSVRDREVIEAADAHGMAMVLTGVRHFKH